MNTLEFAPAQEAFPHHMQMPQSGFLGLLKTGVPLAEAFLFRAAPSPGVYQDWLKTDGFAAKVNNALQIGLTGTEAPAQKAPQPKTQFSLINGQVNHYLPLTVKKDLSPEHNTLHYFSLARLKKNAQQAEILFYHQPKQKDANQEKIFFLTGLYVPTYQWDKERKEVRASHPDYANLNAKLLYLQTRALELARQGKNVDEVRLALGYSPISKGKDGTRIHRSRKENHTSAEPTTEVTPSSINVGSLAKPQAYAAVPPLLNTEPLCAVAPVPGEVDLFTLNLGVIKLPEYFHVEGESFSDPVEAETYAFQRARFLKRPVNVMSTEPRLHLSVELKYGK